MTVLPLIFQTIPPWGEEKPQHTAHTSDVSRRGNPKPDSICLYQSPQETGTPSTGIWELIDQEPHIWKYRDSDGNYAKDGWIYVYNPYSQDKEKYSWFHFDKDGVMTYGWYKAEKRIWYYCHEISDGSLGKLVKGWHEDSQDGQRVNEAGIKE